MKNNHYNNIKKNSIYFILNPTGWAENERFICVPGLFCGINVQPIFWKGLRVLLNNSETLHYWQKLRAGVWTYYVHMISYHSHFSSLPPLHPLTPETKKWDMSLFTSQFSVGVRISLVYESSYLSPGIAGGASSRQCGEWLSGRRSLWRS